MKNQPPLAIKKIEPQRSELNTLLEHFQNKQYDEAERLALALTDKFKLIHLAGRFLERFLIKQVGYLKD